MKKFILVFIAALTVMSCEKEEKNYVTVSGEVQNLAEDADSITIFIPDGYKKQFAINLDGTFKDTLNITEGKYQFKIGDEYGTIYLKNNEDIKIVTDYKDFDQQLVFEGGNKSADISNAYINNYKLASNYLNEETLGYDQTKFDSVINVYEKEYAAFKEKNKNLEPSIWKELDAGKNDQIKGFRDYYTKSQEIKAKFTGKASPQFAMEDVKGNIVRLSDFKGKYVYIDVWAMWCGPCKREIPALKELENQYHDKDIVFVSMSIDEPKEKEKWKNFVAKEELKGVQIFAENAWKSDFVQAYEIQGIPRFILVGPDGNIISPDAPRPSDDKLVELFNELNI